MSGSNNNDANNGSRSPKGLSRRKFLLGSAATAAGAAVTVNSERANAFFNLLGFMKKPTGNGQTSNGYTIEQSLRFNSATSPYLRRVPSSAGSQTTWTYSAWIKLTNLSIGSGSGGLKGTMLVATNEITTGTTGSMTGLWYNSSNKFNFQSCAGGATTYNYTPAQLFRDPGAWGHLVLVLDTTNATPGNRVRMYWNGVVFSSASDPGAGVSMFINGTLPHYLCSYYDSTYGYLTNDLYLAEVNFIDGQALTPSSFGQVDTNSGQWIPKKYSGAYGSQGYYLNFSNSANLGQDSSGNNNHWTPNGFQTYDQVLDSPTNNFCTLNTCDKDPGTVVSNGSLTYSSSVNRNAPVRATTSIPSTGKWYWEVRYDSGAMDTGFGISAFNGDINVVNALWNGVDTYEYYRGGGYRRNNATNSSYGIGASNGDILSIAIDTSTGSIWFADNGTWMNSATAGEIASGATTHAAFTGIPMSKTFLPFIEAANGPQWTINFGQGGQTGLIYDPASGGRFKYAPPAGFKALCTVNLPSNMPVVTSGTFTGNANADGPFVWLGGAPTDLTINGNAVTWGTHADKLANGFKVRTSSASYNASGSNSFSATVPAKFKWTTARANP